MYHSNAVLIIGGKVRGLGRGIWEPSVLSASIFRKSKTSLKHSLVKKQTLSEVPATAEVSVAKRVLKALSMLWKDGRQRGQRALPGLFWQLYGNETLDYNISKMHWFLFSNIRSLYACLIFTWFLLFASFQCCWFCLSAFLFSHHALCPCQKKADYHLSNDIDHFLCAVSTWHLSIYLSSLQHPVRSVLLLL